MKISSPESQSKSSKSRFTISEDTALKMLVSKYGTDNWELISKFIGTKNIRQCHDRWYYYLSPEINKNPWTEEEDLRLWNLTSRYGRRWVQIAKHFEGRTDTQIKNRIKVLQRKFRPETQIENTPAIQKQQDLSTFLFANENIIDELFNQLNDQVVLF